MTEKKEQKEPHLGMFLQDVDGNFWGVANYDKLKEAPRYKKIFAFISKRYKRKFMTLDPMTIENKDKPKIKIKI